jgi:hypothetical protein
VQAEPTDYFSALTELRELLIAELIFSGELARMAERFTARLAMGREAAEPPSVAAIAEQHAEFLERLDLKEREVPEWVSRVGRDEAWLDKMLQLEATYAAARAAVLTPQARQREIGSLRLELTAFELEIIEFDSHDAACEALFCVRNDGMTMEEVANEGRYPFHCEQLLLEDIGAEMQQQFLSVTPGAVLEPMETEGAFRLCRVMAKSEPNPEDVAVRQRVERRLWDRHLSEVVSKHVHWDLLLS